MLLLSRRRWFRPAGELPRIHSVLCSPAECRRAHGALQRQSLSPTASTPLCAGFSASGPPHGCRTIANRLYRRRHLRLSKRESCLECSDAAASAACHLANAYVAAFPISTLDDTRRHAFLALDESRPARPAAGTSCLSVLRLSAICPNNDGEHFVPYASCHPFHVNNGARVWRMWTQGGM